MKTKKELQNSYKYVKEENSKLKKELQSLKDYKRGFMDCLYYIGGGK